VTDAHAAPPPGSDAPGGPNVPAVSPQVLLLAVVLGVIGALAASILLEGVSAATELVWTTLPRQLGFGEPPDWWVFVALLVAALFVFVAWRLPGRTGGGPLSGLHFDLDQRTAPGFLLAAIGTLVFGAVLGPEAPLIALGTGLGALIFARKGGPVKQLGMLLTGGAAIGSIFGNPFITAFLFLEFAAFGALPAIALVPLFVALASGYIVEIGINHFVGLGTHSLAVPGIPPYDQLLGADIIGGILIAVIAGAVTILVRQGAARLEKLGGSHPAAVLFGGALLTAMVAVLARAITGQPLETVLFSGQSGMPLIVDETAAGTVVVLLAAKAIAYSVGLGAGFRGGPIFPAAALGTAAGVLASLLIGDLALAPMVVSAMAASIAASLKMPFTSALMAVLITSGVGVDVVPLAVIGAVVGLVMRQALDRRDVAEGLEAAPAATGSK
jgi:H+/Cl- antiporter ClcA